MRILVTGREGQVVSALAEKAAGPGVDLIALGRPELDLAGPASAIRQAVLSARPNAIVSAAAYTQVDKAESERELVFAINERGPRALAEAAAELAVPIVHLSTDYVFDGSKEQPYVEMDPTGPTGVYGASKLAGEQAIRHLQPNSAILRTAWVYSPFGANFVKTMLRLAADREEISVVADQVGNPTSALEIAEGVLEVMKNLLSSSGSTLRGVFHMTAAGDASWADFAEAIFTTSSELGGPTARVRRITTTDYPTAAKRPSNSRLNCDKLEQAHGVRLPDWRGSLKPVVGRLVATGS